MSDERNELGQVVGREVPGWVSAQVPSPEPMIGRLCRVERLVADVHARDLFWADRVDSAGANWTYLPYGPFVSWDLYGSWITDVARLDDPMFFAIVDASTGRANGLASYLRISAEHGSIEVGNINFSPLLQRTTAGTEAMYLMMSRAFDDWGYRRYEWKCNALNAPSMAAARRLGFTFEGIHRQAKVSKGRNRDTAWFSITDEEWPAMKQRLVAWLDPSNFDEAGLQRTPLSTLAGG